MTAFIDSDMAAARERIARAYDPQLIEASGQKLTELLSSHLRCVQSSGAKVLNWALPVDNLRVAGETVSAPAFPFHETAVPPSPKQIADQFAELVKRMLSHGHNLHDPRYVGHQVPASVPLAGLFDAVGSVTNQVMAIYEMGPWATAVEQAMIGELGKHLGWDGTDYGAIVTHGASLANLTALLVARNVTLSSSWERGLVGGPQPVLVAQADAHYCIARSAGILGFGTDHVIKAALDDRRRMDPVRLDATLHELKAKGHPIVAVAACACATPIGAFDPLEQIADVCEKHGVWLHVDAAHGGAALLSERHRALVRGLERADSFTWDAHKMLFVPALCAFLFYKRKAHSYEAFRQHAPYLFDPSAPDLSDFDGGLRTVECTKRAAVYGLWGVWSLFGKGLFEDLVDVTFDLGQTFYRKLQESADFQALHEPQCNIVVFRHVPEALRHAPPEQIGEFQLKLRRNLIESGEFYLVPATFGGQAVLRVTLINPLTTPAHLDQLLETLRRRGDEILRK